MYRAIIAVIFLWTVVLFSKPMASLSGNEMRERLKSRLGQELGPNVTLSVENLSVREGVPENAVLGMIHPVPPLGLIHFEWQWNDGERIRKVSGNATVRAFAKIAIARTQIKHQEPLTIQNVKFERWEITHHRNTGYYLGWDGVIGLRAMGFITPGTVIGTNNATSPALVSAGQMVDLIYQRGPLKITGRVKALDGGNLSQWIRVQNPRSLKIFQAKVSGTGEVTTR